MTHILKNRNIEIYVDLPDEGYKNSRFDWTGKITSVKYKGKPLSGNEIPNQGHDQFYGKGFYNEFGINCPLSYNETEKGGWFHKIGIGLLKKEESEYEFHKQYEIKPADFKVDIGATQIRIICKSESINGYSYRLEKEIQIQKNGFEIRYFLQNTGAKDIITDEYTHNFISLDREDVGKDYVLKFPFRLITKLFKETVNPEGIVQFSDNEIGFADSPSSQFFFSNLSAGKSVKAQWELENTKNKIGISEQGDFTTKSINLWGRKEVISPELFIDLNIKAGHSKRWLRSYNIYEIEELKKAKFPTSG